MWQLKAFFIVCVIFFQVFPDGSIKAGCECFNVVKPPEAVRRVVQYP